MLFNKQVDRQISSARLLRTASAKYVSQNLYLITATAGYGSGIAARKDVCVCIGRGCNHPRKRLSRGKTQALAPDRWGRLGKTQGKGKAIIIAHMYLQNSYLSFKRRNTPTPQKRVPQDIWEHEYLAKGIKSSANGKCSIVAVIRLHVSKNQAT